MKNIHILPTDKPSKLFIDNGILELDYKSIVSEDYWIKNQHIYITKSEEIKNDVYCLINGVLCKTELLNDKIVSRQLVGGGTMDICKSEYSEIILTTDQDLIKDGVQAINDEFLEWFIKNPSCKSIKTLKTTIARKNGIMLYKIIIPEESNIISEWLQKNGNPEIAKQVEEEARELCGETLEEKAERIVSEWYGSGELEMQDCFIKGYKLAQKESYSEEEVLKIVHSYRNHFELYRNLQVLPNMFFEWFEQFKKNKMKNIYMLPTDNPSKIGYHFDIIKNGRIDYSPNFGIVEFNKKFNFQHNPQDIYITTHVQLDIGDYYLDKDNMLYKHKFKKRVIGNKIILTTNKNLIKKGIQAIDDTFLEWFVENPNCEEIKINKSFAGTYYTGYPYKVILPTEGYICPETNKQCYDECCVDPKDCHIRSSIGVIFDSSDEVLSNSAKEQYKNIEKVYTEDQVIDILSVFLIENNSNSKVTRESIKKRFEQFKNDN